MNPLLQVKLKMNHESRGETKPVRNLRKNAKVTSSFLTKIISQLQSVEQYYKSQPEIIQGYLIDVKYTDMISKSSRIREILKPASRDINQIVVGNRFSDDPEGQEKHIITYYVDQSTLRNTITNIQTTISFLNERLSGHANDTNFKEPGSKIDYIGYPIKKTKLRDIIIDASVIESISVPQITAPEKKDNFLITLFRTELSTADIFDKLQLRNPIYYPYGDNTISVDWSLYIQLKERIPYMISMISDLSQIQIEDITGTPSRESLLIPQPTNEPTIGVIDKLYDQRSYFADWVEYNEFLDDVEKSGKADDMYVHGTQVSSIIVDGPSLNPELDDGCGRFRVRHFGVSTSKISVPRLVNKIRKIIIENPDIHVWNLSLGTLEEVSKNYISFDAAVLDELQTQYNVIFVISGTNDLDDPKPTKKRIGSPADSLNSIVVNSVKQNNKPASYSRTGNVLSFFLKPDVSYYGGDRGEPIKVYSFDYGISGVYGTSFAAPWISRKMCYLIDILGLPREIAKALLIDSAAGWRKTPIKLEERYLIGHGIVPKHINDVISCANDEIRFYIYGAATSYRTTNYGIPVPKDDEGKYPFLARATMCYFPECSRQQGVDYTNRELTIKFGRVKSDDSIEDINENKIDEKDSYVTERIARREFRKWDNTKLISNLLKNSKPRIAYEDRLWGLSITSMERLTSHIQKELNFGAVITLKEMKGINRVQEFIRNCNLRGWIVTEVNIENRVNLYNVNQEDITLE